MSVKVTYRATQRLITPRSYYNSAKQLILSDPDSLRYKTRFFTADAETEHRQRPNPLWANPTGQSLQYRKRLYDGLIESPFIPWYSNYTKSWTQDLNPDPSPLFPQVFPTELDWQTKMRLDIKNISVNLASNLAEYRESCGMFYHFARSAYHAYQVVRGRRRRKRITACAIPAAELGYSFGVAPLASDVFNSYYALKERLDQNIIRRVSSFARDEGSPTINNGQGDLEVKWRMSQRATCYIRLVPDWHALTPGNPLEWAWEVIPFSFVVDWAIPIGDALSSLDALKDVEAVIGTVTTKRNWRHTFTHNSVLAGNGYFYKFPTYATYDDHKRAIVNSIPLPRVPTWDPSTSWAAVRHGLSLLWILRDSCSGKK